MTDFDFTGADWNLICDLQELCSKHLFDSKNLQHNNHQVNIVLNAGWTLFKLKLAPVTVSKEIDMKKLFDEFEEWFLGTKYTGTFDFEDFLKEVIK